MFTLLKHFLSWKALKTLWQRKKLLLQEQSLPLSQCFQMSSAATDEYLLMKWLIMYILIFEPPFQHSAFFNKYFHKWHKAKRFY